MAAPPCQRPHSTIHPGPLPSRISHRPLRHHHHGSHLCHCHCPPHCRLFFPGLRTHGRFWILTPTGCDDQRGFQKDGPQWKGCLTYGPGSGMRHDGDDDDTHFRHRKGSDHCHIASGPWGSLLCPIGSHPWNVRPSAGLLPFDLALYYRRPSGIGRLFGSPGHPGGRL